MRVSLLKKDYSNNLQIYEDFKNNKISSDKDYFSKDFIDINEAPDFPVYIGHEVRGNKRELYRHAISTLMHSYIQEPRSTHTNGLFWHSLLIQYKRDYLIDLYPRILNSHKEFNLIVFRKFDWSNYIYKCVYAAEYIYDAKFETKEEINKYIDLIYDNLDVYNYIIKYPLFRNSQFTIKFLTVIDDNNLSEDLKAKISDRPDLGDDTRYGREVIAELNRSYPVLNAPALSTEELGEEVLSILKRLRY